MAKQKKLTVDEFKRRVKEAIEEPLPSQNGTRRSQPQRSGIIQDLLKGTNRGKSPSPIKEKI